VRRRSAIGHPRKTRPGRSLPSIRRTRIGRGRRTIAGTFRPRIRRRGAVVLLEDGRLIDSPSRDRAVRARGEERLRDRASISGDIPVPSSATSTSTSRHGIRRCHFRRHWFEGSACRALFSRLMITCSSSCATRSRRGASGIRLEPVRRLDDLVFRMATRRGHVVYLHPTELFDLSGA